MSVEHIISNDWTNVGLVCEVTDEMDNNMQIEPVHLNQSNENLDLDQPLPPRSCPTRFATLLVTFCFYRQFLTRTFNYCSKLEKKRARDNDDIANLYQIQKIIFDQADDLDERLSYIYDCFGLLPVYLCKLESQSMVVNEVEQMVDRIRQYLKKGLFHPLEPKYQTVQKALVKFENVVKARSLELFNLAKLNPIFNRAPCHSIKVEADFSIIKYCIGHRRHFNDANKTDVLQSVLRQKGISPKGQKRVSILFLNNLQPNITKICFV